MVWPLWAAALAPLLLFDRDFARVGLDPVYLLDLLVVLALLAGSPAWAPRVLSESRLRGYRACAVLLALAATQAVVRGVWQGYPGALKGSVLGLYPLFAWGAATWALGRPAEEFPRRRWLLYLPAAGTFAAAALGRPIMPAAAGLYLAIAGAFGMIMRGRGDNRLLLWTLAGAACLTAVADKRGPLLAVGAAIAAAWLAGQACHRGRAQVPVLTLGFVVVGLVAVLGMSVAHRQPSDLPVVGGLMSRLEAGEHDTGSEAANNVQLRYVMWREALEVARSEPLTGGGAGRPIEVVFQGAQLDKAAAGPHNSFVGYFYYLGWPAGTAFALLIVATLWRTWRARSHPVASAWFGATVGVCCIAFTNVAFETTYIGLPSWLVVACAFALVGVPRTGAPAGEPGPEFVVEPVAAKEPRRAPVVRHSAPGVLTPRPEARSEARSPRCPVGP
ncbi:O-antigen ligase family protein [Streptomyces sp. YIM S03343]